MFQMMYKYTLGPIYYFHLSLDHCCQNSIEVNSHLNNHSQNLWSNLYIQFRQESEYQPRLVGQQRRNPRKTYCNLHHHHLRLRYDNQDLKRKFLVYQYHSNYQYLHHYLIATQNSQTCCLRYR